MRLPRQNEFRVNSPLLDFLLMAERRPGMYYGSRDLADVRMVLHGWMMHRAQVPDSDPFAEVFGEFHDFVSTHFSDDRTMGWAAMISENAATDSAAFDQFMALVREFAGHHFGHVT